MPPVLRVRGAAEPQAGTAPRAQPGKPRVATTGRAISSVWRWRGRKERSWDRIPHLAALHRPERARPCPSPRAPWVRDGVVQEGVGGVGANAGRRVSGCSRRIADCVCVPCAWPCAFPPTRVLRCRLRMSRVCAAPRTPQEYRSDGRTVDKIVRERNNAAARARGPLPTPHSSRAGRGDLVLDLESRHSCLCLRLVSLYSTHALSSSQPTPASGSPTPADRHLGGRDGVERGCED